MKVQEVMLRAMAKKITWWQAAEILGITERHMRRLRERYEEQGYDGLMDRRRGKPSVKRVPLEQVEQVLALYRERYFDLNVCHFHEKLREEHGIDLSYTWVKMALQGAGLVAKAGKRGVHRRRRERRPVPGMLLHIDGSHHQWFQDERWYDRHGGNLLLKCQEVIGRHVHRLAPHHLVLGGVDRFHCDLELVACADVMAGYDAVNVEYPGCLTKVDRGSRELGSGCQGPDSQRARGIQGIGNLVARLAAASRLECRSHRTEARFQWRRKRGNRPWTLSGSRPGRPALF